MKKIRFKVLVEDLSEIQPEIWVCGGEHTGWLCVNLASAVFMP